MRIGAAVQPVQIRPSVAIRSAIPDELLSRPQWLAWLSVHGEGQRLKLPSAGYTGILKKQEKPHKLPINPLTGGLAATNRAATWATFEAACQAVQKWSLAGVGFVFTESDPYSGVDIDNCRHPKTGQIADWAWAIIRALDSYTEVSPSRTGVHIILRGKLPVGQGNQIALHGGKVEMFSRARYFTFTGTHVDGTATEIFDRQIELLALHAQLFSARRSPDVADISRPTSHHVSDDELIEKARRAQNGPKFGRLFSGRWEGDYSSQSEADLGLCCQLAFWTNKDSARIDALFRRSGLMRQKWLRKDYRVATISRAIECTDKTWSSGRQEERVQKRIERPSKSMKAVAAPEISGGAVWEPPIPFHQFELPPFPVDALPDWLRAFVVAEATATQTPVDLAGMLILSIIGAACAKKVVVRMKKGYQEPLNIFTVTALAPGNRKTTVFKAVMKPLEDYERREALRTSADIARARAAHKIKEGALKRLQEQAVSGKGKERDRLAEEAGELAAELDEVRLEVATRLVADDCTPEKLATLLREQRGRLAVMSPEGDVFDLMAGRYSSNGTGNLGVYLKGHAGDALRIDRVGKPPDFVEDPALTIGLAVQPDVLRGLAEKPGFRGRGLLGRFLYAVPSSLLGHRDTNPASVPDDVRSAYETKVSALLNLPSRKDQEDDNAPQVLNLDPDARTAMAQFESWVEPKLAEFGELGGISDWAGKLVGAVGRITGILHMADLAGVPAPWEIHIPPDVVGRAVKLGHYFIPHAKVAFAEMGADVVVEHAKAILRWIEHTDLGSFTKRDAHQGLRSRFKRVEEIDSPLALLESHCFIRKQAEVEQAGPGRPRSHTYEVNPGWAHKIHDQH